MLSPRFITRTTVALAAIIYVAVCVRLETQARAWEHWGGDLGGTRYSPLSRITSDNVGKLIRAWEFRTGDLTRRESSVMARTKFEATPIFVGDSLVLCTPFNEVIALDPGTGVQRWRFDPKISTMQRPANRFNCRGVAYWTDPSTPVGEACNSRIFTGTNDMRLIAIDAKTGSPCVDFGDGGEIKISSGMPLEWAGEMQITSPPLIVRDIVVVGSAIADNRRVTAPSGSVRAFDAKTGKPRWTWDPLVHEGIKAGGANVWAPMSGDEKLGLLFLPTSSPSPDFWGGKRPGNNEHADSVVALHAETGQFAWAYQTVHHDLWDYDLAAQPTLAAIDTETGLRDVVIQPTKQGFLFVFDKVTGKPVWPIEEGPVPQNGAEGEFLSPTQPYPTHVPALTPQRLADDEAFGALSFWDRAACLDKIKHSRNDGLFTPPSTTGSVVFPMTGGGVNWGGAAFDPVHQILYANTSRAAQIVTLVPTKAQASLSKVQPGHDFGPQRGAPYAVTRETLLSPLEMPCNPPPWGAMVAVDLKAGKILWQSTVGTTEDRAPLGMALPFGTPLVNGVVVTGGGLVFTGAMDAYLRAFRAETGEELWQGRLPVPGVANPMTYEWNNEQFVVISAGGQSEAGTSIGDSVVAFRLARGNETPSIWSRTVDRPGGRFLITAMLTALAIVLFFAVVRRSRKDDQR